MVSDTGQHSKDMGAPRPKKKYGIITVGLLKITLQIQVSELLYVGNGAVSETLLELSKPQISETRI
jgi:hypothetical protein